MWQSISYYALLTLESLVGAFGIRLYEEPSYEVIGSLGDRVEIRSYAPRLAASVTLPGTGKNIRGQAFRLLFDYIAGTNRSGADRIAMTVPVAVREPELVAMTVPVETSEAEGELRMRFFLPAKFEAGTAPQPLDDRVQLITVPAENIAALRYSGSGRDFAARQSELVKLLGGSRWQPSGKSYTLFYDAPFTLPFVRRNEAAVAVTDRVVDATSPRR